MGAFKYMYMYMHEKASTSMLFTHANYVHTLYAVSMHAYTTGYRVPLSLSLSLSLSLYCLTIRDSNLTSTELSTNKH